eukprot:gene2228-3254_t
MRLDMVDSDDERDQLDRLAAEIERERDVQTRAVQRAAGFKRPLLDGNASGPPVAAAPAAHAMGCTCEVCRTLPARL